MRNYVTEESFAKLRPPPFYFGFNFSIFFLEKIIRLVTFERHFATLWSGFVVVKIDECLFLESKLDSTPTQNELDVILKISEVRLDQRPSHYFHVSYETSISISLRFLLSSFKSDIVAKKPRCFPDLISMWAWLDVTPTSYELFIIVVSTTRATTLLASQAGRRSLRDWPPQGS